MGEMARRLYRDNRKMLDLVAKQGPDSGFGPAVKRVFGNDPVPGSTVRIGSRVFIYSGTGKNLVSFMPASWRDELEKTRGTWPGCENW